MKNIITSEMMLKIMTNLNKTHKTVAIIPNKDPKYNSFIPHFYEFLETDSRSVIIIQPAEMVCSMKFKHYDYYLLFCSICLHSKFEKKISYNIFHSINELEAYNENKVFEINQLLMSAQYKLSFEPPTTNNIHKKPTHDIQNNFLESEALLEINQENISTFTKIKQNDFISFLISRLSQVEKSKTKQVYNIIFTNPKYQPLADKIEKYLLNISKLRSRDSDKYAQIQELLVYKTYLMDTSYERLTAIDNVEVIVLIDCPNFIPFDNEILIPMITPFELSMLFDEWKDGKYFPNNIDFIDNFFLKDNEDANINREIDVISYDNNKIVNYKNKISVLNTYIESRNLAAVPFYKEEDGDEEDEIGDGRSGIASGYKNEDTNS